MAASKSAPVLMGRQSKPDPAVAKPDAPAVLKAAWEVHRVPLMAALTAKLGDLDRAEEALAEAALRAHRSWAVTIPDNPSGWLYRVALNAARDSQRREAVRLKAAPALGVQSISYDDDPLTVSPEARVNLFRLCAAPNLSTEQQIALMLFHLGGLDCARIAAAFLVSESVIYQRLSRARTKLKNSDDEHRDCGDLASIRSALEVIYHQSYRDVAGGTEAEALGRDAIHLTQALCSAGADDPENWALLAFLHSLDARRPARLSDDGVFIPFDAQDVTRWYSPSLRDAAAAMQKAASLATGPQPYGLRAQIELTRIIARQEGRSCDTELLGLYDDLIQNTQSPFARVERALIIARLEGAAAGLSALSDIPANRDLSGHAGWHLAKADLHSQAGNRAQTRLHLKAALTLEVGKAERNFVQAKLDRLLP